MTQFCASATFTDPVNITSVVESLLKESSGPSSTPATSFADSDTVKRDMAEEAVKFFGDELE